MQENIMTDLGKVTEVTKFGPGRFAEVDFLAEFN